MGGAGAESERRELPACASCPSPLGRGKVDAGRVPAVMGWDRVARPGLETVAAVRRHARECGRPCLFGGSTYAERGAEGVRRADLLNLLGHRPDAGRSRGVG